jgi:hypothetical protein
MKGPARVNVFQWNPKPFHKNTEKGPNPSKGSAHRWEAGAREGAH